ENFGSLGEWAINKAKSTIFEGKYAEDAETQADGGTNGVATKALQPANLDVKYRGQTLVNHQLGIQLPREISAKQLKVGEWYPIEIYKTVYVSILAPGMVSKEILNNYSDRVQPLQPREINSLAYLVAFDMKKYSMGWAHGTKLPGVGWSDRMSAEAKRTFG